MKTTSLVFMMIGCATLIAGTGYAAPASPAFQQTSNESSANTARDHSRDTAHASPAGGAEYQKQGKRLRSSASLTKASRPRQVLNNRERSASGNATKVQRPGSSQFGAARGASGCSETVSRALPIRPPNAVHPSVSSLNNVRHRGSNPAVIGGLANVETMNASAINGTRMNRRP